MSSFPITRGSSQALYPCTQTLSFLTEVCEFRDGSSQRWARRPGGCIVTWDFPYERISKTKKDAIKTAVLAAKGQQSTSISLSVAGITFPTMSLASDTFQVTEKVTTLYGMTLRFVGTAAQALTAGSGGAFPALASGAASQLPFSQGHRWATEEKTVDSGSKYTYAFWSAQLQQWQLGFTSISDADLAAIMQHFVWAQGRYRAFTFTDPEDSTAYTKAHYASDDLVITYNGPNQTSLTVSLEVTR